jgi:hypothetical protein
MERVPRAGNLGAHCAVQHFGNSDRHLIRAVHAPERAAILEMGLRNHWLFLAVASLRLERNRLRGSSGLAHDLCNQ